jgi:ATP-dependent Clp protease, protease subunit
VQRFANGLTLAANGGIKRIHMLFQTNGGMVPDGICLYNIFRSAPIEINLYNAGSIASIGVVAYLGAQKRKASQNATFMIHKTHFSPIAATANRLQSAADAALLDDRRIEGILHAHMASLPKEKWELHTVADVWLSADEALDAGLVTQIEEFKPPKGVQLFYLGPV